MTQHSERFPKRYTQTLFKLSGATPAKEQFAYSTNNTALVFVIFKLESQNFLSFVSDTCEDTCDRYYVLFIY